MVKIIRKMIISNIKGAKLPLTLILISVVIMAVQNLKPKPEKIGTSKIINVREYYHHYKIPDIRTWDEVQYGNRLVIADPRVDFVGIKANEWEDPVLLPSNMDPLGIFRQHPPLRMDDELLIDHLRQNVLVRPSSKAYNLRNIDLLDYSEHNATSTIIWPLIQEIKGQNKSSIKGTFFEAGVLDGETRSRTLFLEKQLNWTGLTVEMTYPNAEIFLTKQRKCWFAPVCISPQPRPIRRNMRFAYDPKDPWLERTGTINQRKWVLVDEKASTNRKYVYTVVDCYPLYSLLLAANMTSIDFMSLDLEGVELQVLTTIPFHVVNISVISVETLHTEEGSEEVEKFMRRRGYNTYQHPLTQEQRSNKTGYFYDTMVFIKS